MLAGLLVKSDVMEACQNTGSRRECAGEAAGTIEGRSMHADIFASCSPRFGAKFVLAWGLGVVFALSTATNGAKIPGRTFSKGLSFLPVALRERLHRQSLNFLSCCFLAQTYPTCFSSTPTATFLRQDITDLTTSGGKGKAFPKPGRDPPTRLDASRRDGRDNS